MNAQTVLMQRALEAEQRIQELLQEGAVARERRTGLVSLEKAFAAMAEDGHLSRDELKALAGGLAALGVDPAAITAAYEDAVRGADGLDLEGADGAAIQNVIFEVFDEAMADLDRSGPENAFMLQLHVGRASLAISTLAEINKKIDSALSTAIKNIA